MLKLSHNGKEIVVATEREARAWARDALGVARVYETPDTDGWLYWASPSESAADDAVRCEVVS